MSKIKTIFVKENPISIDENDYFSLTDMARCINEKVLPSKMIASWLGNFRTLQFLNVWEKMHNDKFNIKEMEKILLEASENRIKLSPEEYIKQTTAIGIISKLDYNDDIFAHKDIALYFSYLSLPEFKVYFLKEFTKLKKEQKERDATTWKISKIMDGVNKVQILLDTMRKQENNSSL